MAFIVINECEKKQRGVLKIGRSGSGGNPEIKEEGKTWTPKKMGGISTPGCPNSDAHEIKSEKKNATGERHPSSKKREEK